jgi:hypothetical protein
VGEKAGGRGSILKEKFESLELELSVETLRELTDDQLTQVAGGAYPTGTGLYTQTPVCPSGATWFAPCE